MIRTPTKVNHIPACYLASIIKDRNSPRSTHTKDSNLSRHNNRRDVCTADIPNVRNGDSPTTEISGCQFPALAKVTETRDLSGNIEDRTAGDVLDIRDD